MLIESGAVPRHPADDTARIAIAVTNGVESVVAWNFQRMADTAMRARIERVCRQMGHEPPVIRTPGMAGTFDGKRTPVP